MKKSILIFSLSLCTLIIHQCRSSDEELLEEQDSFHSESQVQMKESDSLKDVHLDTDPPIRDGHDWVVENAFPQP